MTDWHIREYMYDPDLDLGTLFLLINMLVLTIASLALTLSFLGALR